jgi:2-C-methyl-D-erythritol 4-phosphate cytidylyltransferase
MTLDLMRQHNVVVTAVSSPADNVKVTVPLDLVLLEQWNLSSD